jgi:hypothetical protein
MGRHRKGGRDDRKQKLWACKESSDERGDGRGGNESKIATQGKRRRIIVQQAAGTQIDGSTATLLDAEGATMEETRQTANAATG